MTRLSEIAPLLPPPYPISSADLLLRFDTVLGCIIDIEDPIAGCMFVRMYVCLFVEMYMLDIFGGIIISTFEYKYTGAGADSACKLLDCSRATGRRGQSKKGQIRMLRALAPSPY